MEDARAAHPLSAVIVPVQILRGVAASLVVAGHLLERLQRRGAFPHGIGDWAERFGHIGVVTFFAISGFIMVHTTIGEFGVPGAGRRFILRRIERIVPLYALTTLAMIGFAWATFGVSTNAVYVAPSARMLVLSALFVPYIGRDGLAQPVYQLGWTLEYEMFFYAVFALALGWRRRAGMALALAGLAALVMAGAWVPVPAPVVGQVVAAFYFTRPIMLYFAAGMVVAWVRVARGAWRLAVPESAIGATAGVVLAAALMWSAAGPGLVVLAVALATLVTAGRGGPAIVTRLARRFGDVSYSIYLTHSFLLGAVAAAAWRFAARGMGWLVAVELMACGGCALAAWPVWRFVERPVTRALQRGRLSCS